MNIVITPAAEKFIRRMIRFGGVPGGGFRLAVSPGGCSGLAAEFSVERDPRAGEAVLEHNGLKLFLPVESRLLLDGVTVDCADTPTESGLVFRDPKGSGPACGSQPNAPVELVNLTTFGSRR
ncbi:MAG: iron-sulfur cluster biosynthesis family protein [Bryobacteraceae bacterium]|jgi:iron-sulfur cluster assembly accessory protein